MIAPRTVPRHIGPAWVRDETHRSALRATEELATMLHAPASHLTPERVQDAIAQSKAITAYLHQLHESVERVALCERQGTCPDYTDATRAAAQQAIEERAGMSRSIGPASWEFPWETGDVW